MDRFEIEQVEAAVESIRAMSADDEAAHSTEDKLHRDVLRSIAEHTTDPYAEAVARVALQTESIDFARWCA